MTARRMPLGARERLGVSLVGSLALHVALLAALLGPRFQSPEKASAVRVSLRLPDGGAEPAGSHGVAVRPPAPAAPEQRADRPARRPPPRARRAAEKPRAIAVKPAAPPRIDAPPAEAIDSLAESGDAPAPAERDRAAAPTGAGYGAAGGGSGGVTRGGGSGSGEGTRSGAGDLRVACDYCPTPRYPRAAVARRAEGTVQVGFTLTPDGRAGDVEVRRSSGDRELDHAALAVARRSRFRRAAGGGEAARGYLEYQFQLARRS